MKRLSVLVLVALFFNSLVYSKLPPINYVTIGNYSIDEDTYNYCIDQITDIFNDYRDYFLQHVIDPIMIGKELRPEVLYNLQNIFDIDLSNNAHRAVIRNFYNNLFIPIDHYEIRFHEYRMCKLSIKKAVGTHSHTRVNVFMPITCGQPVEAAICEQFKQEFNLDLSDPQTCAMIKYYFTS